MTRSKLWLAAFVSLLMLSVVDPAHAQETTLRSPDSVEVVLIIVGLAAVVVLGFVYAARGSDNSSDEE